MAVKHVINNEIDFSVERLEDRRLLTGAGATSANQYDIGCDPNVGAVVTAFIENDPADPLDSFDIRTGWLEAVDELAAIGSTEVTFAVYRVVGANGRMRGGPSLDVVSATVSAANARGLKVTILPVFELDQLDWRGEYNPTGANRNRFQSDYSSLITELAELPGVARLNVGSELNAMVNDVSNHDFFGELVDDVRAAGFTGRVGYVANFDAYDNAQHTALWQDVQLDYLGISAYFSIIDPQDASLVSGTGPVTQAVETLMVTNWEAELDQLEQFADGLGLPILIQEFGAVQRNYASVYPYAVTPGQQQDGLPNANAADADEQRATYASLIAALDGRGDSFESVHFWSWEHQADRGERSYEGVDPNEPRYINHFSIWPDDGGAGEFLASFLATAPINQLPEISIIGPSIITPGFDSTYWAEAMDADGDPLTFQFEIIDASGAVVAASTEVQVAFEPTAFGDYVARLSVSDGRATVTAEHDIRSTPIRLQGNVLNIFGTSGSDRILIRPASGTSVNGISATVNGQKYTIAGLFDQVKVFALDGDDIVKISNSTKYNATFEVKGGDGNDKLTGGRQDDILLGQGGDDRLRGGGGNDRLSGGAGSDQIDGGAGDDRIAGGQFVGADDLSIDRLLGKAGSDLFFVGAGDQLIGFRAGLDSLAD